MHSIYVNTFLHLQRNKKKKEFANNRITNVYFKKTRFLERPADM